MAKQLFRMRTNHKIVVQKLGEGFERKGACVKFPAVFYVDRKGELASRSAGEFERMFERCE